MNEPEALYARALHVLPAWNDPAPAEERRHEALVLMREAGRLGHPKAMLWLARSDPDREARFDCALALAHAGETSTLVAALFDPDTPSARRAAIFEAALRDEPWALAAVAWIHLAGFEPMPPFVGAPPTKNPGKTGLGYLERSAALGYAPAMHVLARRVAKKEPERALALAQAAIRSGAITEPGNARALADLAVRLLEDVGGAWTDIVDAREALAATGDCVSMVWLGTRLRSGDGLARDVVRARALFEAAAKQLDADAHRELGRMYEDGDGVPSDADLARAHYESAAELGADAFARERLVTRFGLAFYAERPARQRTQTTRKAAKDASTSNPPKPASTVTAENAATATKAAKTARTATGAAPRSKGTPKKRD